MSTSIDEASALYTDLRRRHRSLTLTSAVRWAVKLYRVRRIERELYELDDRMLRDIGLTRTEIPHLARNGRDGRFP